MEQSLSSDSNSLSATQFFFHRTWNSLPCTQEHATGPYLEPNEFCQAVCSPQVSRLKLMIFASRPCVRLYPAFVITAVPRHPHFSLRVWFRQMRSAVCCIICWPTHGEVSMFSASGDPHLMGQGRDGIHRQFSGFLVPFRRKFLYFVKK
jgi:hypothetical protein